MPALPAAFLTHPLAHRALHDVQDGRPENSRAAVQAAMAQGYGIEIDVQLSADGQAIVFHDYDLGRLTVQSGPIAQCSADALGQIPLLHGNESIPTLAEILALVNGQGPVLIELKDQDGALGPNIGTLERAVADVVTGYSGDVAVMSFNPHSVAELARLIPGIPRGLTTCAFTPEAWPLVPEDRRATLRAIPDYASTGSSFISHLAADLASPHVAELLQKGAHVLCWTIRSPEAEAEARKIAQNVTFEGYLA